MYKRSATFFNSPIDMATFLQLFVSAVLFVLLSSSHAQYSFRPNAVVIPVTKDLKTLQYITTISQRTPPVPVNLVVDLGGHHVWMDCESDYISSSYRPARCRSSECSVANAYRCSRCGFTRAPGCNNNTCEAIVQNGITEYLTDGDVSMDLLHLRSTKGYTLGDVVTVPQFNFICTRGHHLQGLASGAKGVAGLSRTRVALPSQLASAFSFDRKFGMCLSNSARSPGAIFFGDGPYQFHQGSDVSKSLVYTKMLRNPVSTSGYVPYREIPSYEYFIGVTSITINGKHLPINTTLLSIGKNGVGGTKFSTVEPYSVLETTIYKAFTESFIREAAAMKITRVASVAPFGACFSSKSIRNVRGRLQVPRIILVLQEKNRVWPIYPTNSMVQVTKDVMCLGFVDASAEVEDVDGRPKAAVLLGGYQLENNFIQFDLATSRVGFTNMLYDFTTTCSSFKSTV